MEDERRRGEQRRGEERGETRGGERERRASERALPEVAGLWPVCLSWAQHKREGAQQSPIKVQELGLHTHTEKRHANCDNAEDRRPSNYKQIKNNTGECSTPSTLLSDREGGNRQGKMNEWFSSCLRVSVCMCLGVEKASRHWTLTRLHTCPFSSSHVRANSNDLEVIRCTRCHRRHSECRMSRTTRLQATATPRLR